MENTEKKFNDWRDSIKDSPIKSENPVYNAILQDNLEPIYRSVKEVLDNPRFKYFKDAHYRNEFTAKTQEVFKQLFNSFDNLEKNDKVKIILEMLEGFYVPTETFGCVSECSEYNYDECEAEINHRLELEDLLSDRERAIAEDRRLIQQIQNGEYFGDVEPDEEFARQIENEQDFVYSSSRL